MAKGRLRIYLGVAPGVGTTHALVDEAERRRARGQVVVIGALDPPALWSAVDAARIAAFARPLGAGAWDGEAVLAATPDVVLLDDLGAPAPGTDRPRWRLLPELVGAGVDVIATAHITQVASLADLVTELVDARPEVSVPDAVFADADAVELIDMSPAAVRRRLAHGRLVAPEAMNVALAHRYSPEVLAGLRLLAFDWLGGLLRRPLPSTLPRDLILAGVSGGEDAGRVLRRAARLAQRRPGTSVLAVEVVPTAGRFRQQPADADRVRDLATDLGVAYRQVMADDVATALLDVARAERAEIVVVGASGRRRRGGVTDRLLALADDVDVLVVRSTAPGIPLPRLRMSVPRPRLTTGLGLAVVLPSLVTLVGRVQDGWLGVSATSLAYLLAVVVTALVGGLWPALLAAVVSAELLSWFFLPPLGSVRVTDPHSIATLAMFVLVGVLVGATVHRASALADAATRARAESRALAALAEDTLSQTEALPQMLEHGRTSFKMESATLLRREPDDTWTVVGSVGPTPLRDPADADAAVPAGDDLVLAMRGRPMAASDQTVLRAFAAQTRNLLERDTLARSAAQAERLEATERLRDSLLAAVGHDLRRPLASARASVETLRGGVAMTDAQRAELLVGADESLARLSRIVDDLLDLSRLETGALRFNHDTVWLDEVIPPALDELGEAGEQVRLSVPDDLPPADADAALVKRIVFNLVSNAVEHGSGDIPPLVRASAAGDRVQVRIVDSGPGLAQHDREAMFRSFHRSGDARHRGGLGLGLALSRGLAEAMGGTIEAEDTPGGGLTMVLTLSTTADTLGATAPGHRERGEL